MMDGDLWVHAERFLAQDQDLAFALHTATGEFVVESFTAHEAVNELFEVQLNLFSSYPDLDLHALMDTQATLAILSKYDEPRYMTGIITDCARGDGGIRRTAYQITLRPPMARLAHISDGRIWQNVNVVDVVSQLLSAHAIPDCEWKLAEDYPPREYLTQAPGERTLDFIKRILNEVGIFWYFDHQSDKCRTVFTDAPLTSPNLIHAASLAYNNTPGGQSRGSWISRFSQYERLRSSDIEYGEYWFKNPMSSFNQSAGRQENNGTSDDYRRYEFPGRYKDPAQVGKSFVKARIAAERVDATTGEGITNNIHLAPGWHVSITDHPDPKVNASHFLMGVTHHGTQPAALEEDAPDGMATTYEASFTTMPARLPYRPPTPQKPTIDGPQVGIVVGPEGEEIYTDEFGRVRVWLTWDRHAERRRGDGQREEHATCWMRVNQNWTGMGWGIEAIPRINTEVLIAYIDGDCDQPIIIGSARNATNMPPYALPEHKTRTTIKTQTHKGKGFNELRFEDEKDREEIFIHAQKDMNEVILNDRYQQSGRDHFESVGRNHGTHVSGNSHSHTSGVTEINAGLGLSISSGVGRIPLSVASLTRKSGARKSGLFTLVKSKISSMMSAVNTGGISLRAVTNIIEFAGMSRNSVVGLDSREMIGKVKSIHAGDVVQINSGGTTVIATADNTAIESGDRIDIVCGNSSIRLKSSGEIKLKGTKISLN